VANNVTVLDSTGATKTLKATDNASVYTPHHNVDSLPSIPAGVQNIGDVDVLTVVGDNVDLDTDAGTDNHAGIAILLPGAGGHTVGGTAANPVNVALASVPSHAVTNAGTFAVQATLAAETTKVIGTVNVSSGQTVGLAAGTQAIGKLAANSGVDIGDVDVTSLPAIPAGSNLIGKVSIDQATANANEVVVKSGTLTAVTGITNALPAGTNAIGKLAANSGVDIGDVDVTSVAGMPTGANAAQVQGTVAAGGAAAQNPVQIAAKGISTLPAVVDTGDVVNLTADLQGRAITKPHAPSGDAAYGCSAALTDTTSTNVISTDSGANIKWYITDILVTNSHATVGTLVTIEDTAGSPITLWQGFAAALGGGFACHFITPIPTSANVHIHAKCGTTGSNVYVCISAYKAP
jgi:hypothetical protein